MAQADPNRWVWWYKPKETSQRGLYGVMVPARLEDDGITVHGIVAFFRKFGRVMFKSKAVLECSTGGTAAVRFAPGQLIDCPKCLAVDTPVVIDRDTMVLEIQGPGQQLSDTGRTPD